MAAALVGFGAWTSSSGAAASPEVQVVEGRPLPCTSSIFRGTELPTIDRSRSDVVIGPVRFAQLRAPLAVGPLPGGQAGLGIKAPLTIADTRSPTLMITVTGRPSPATASYGSWGSPPSTVLLVQTAVGCGDPVHSFVQYAGGFTSEKRTCLIIGVSDEKRLLGTAKVPLGKGARCHN